MHPWWPTETTVYHGEGEPSRDPHTLSPERPMADDECLAPEGPVLEPEQRYATVEGPACPDPEQYEDNDYESAHYSDEQSDHSNEQNAEHYGPQCSDISRIFRVYIGIF